ncbi:MAG: sulfotransferase family 2 domain-containing protein [Planctomycetota bacterium]
MILKRKPKASKRTVLVHFHIFKNGGTTVDHALKREFRRGFREFDGDHPRHAHLPEEIATFLLDHPKIQVLSSHHLRFPLPEDPLLDLHAALFLRHPLDRMLSIYRYERKQKSQSPGSLHAKKYDYPDYVRWRLDQGRYNLLCDYHASVLTCNPREDKRRPDRELALQRLEAATVCGTVDRLEDSLALAERRLQPLFPGMNLAATPQNVTAGRKRTMTERMEESEKACGSELFAEVASRNELDLELYELASRLLQERIDAEPDGEAMLADYRSRCTQLA